LESGEHFPLEALAAAYLSPVDVVPHPSNGESTPTGDGGDEWPLPDFVGALSSGKGDLAVRSSEILRKEMGRRSE